MRNVISNLDQKKFFHILTKVIPNMPISNSCDNTSCRKWSTKSVLKGSFYMQICFIKKKLRYRVIWANGLFLTLIFLRE